MKNKKFSAIWPNITKKKDPMPEHEKFKEIKNKFKEHFSEKPGKQTMPKIKKVKKVKKLKKLKKIVSIKKSKIVNKKLSKNENLSKNTSTYTPEEKVEIKKIKKQSTEKREYNLKDFVVYPKHGVGRITAVEKATIGEIEIQFYKIYIEKEKLTLTVPINQQFNLRPIASINQINKCVSILKTKPKIKRTMWSRRAQEYDQKINSGKIYELAEVVKDLNKNTDIIADQSYSERQLFEKAY